MPLVFRNALECFSHIRAIEDVIRRNGHSEANESDLARH